MVEPRWPERGRNALQRRACRHGAFRLRDCGNGGRDVHELRAGMLFYIPPGPPGHDSWVVGEEPYVSLHFLGSEHYAKQSQHSDFITSIKFS